MKTNGIFAASLCKLNQQSLGYRPNAQNPGSLQGSGWPANRFGQPTVLFSRRM